MPAYEIIDVGQVQEPSEDERRKLLLDLILTLLDKHDRTITALNKMANQLIMQHGLCDAVTSSSSGHGLSEQR